MTMSNGIPEKKTKGRRKIEIQKIDKKTSLQVSFSKRRKGLFKKAAETRLLCGTDVAIVIQSPGNKFFTFGEPFVESILNRWQFLDDAYNPVVEERGKSEREFWWENENSEKMELRELGAFEETLTGLRDKVSNLASHNPVVEEMGKSEREFWWVNENLERMELRELGSFEEILTRLRDDVSNRASYNPVVEEMGKTEREFWWVNENLERMELRELGAFEEILTGLRDEVSNPASHNPVVEEMGKTEREFCGSMKTWKEWNCVNSECLRRC